MNIAVNNYYNRAAVYPQHAKNKTASFAQVLADTASADLAETTPAKKEQTAAPQKEALLQTWYAGRPLSEWALSDPRYTDEETGISWYVRDGKHPYMTGEDAEKLKQLCEKTGESWLKKVCGNDRHNPEARREHHRLCRDERHCRHGKRRKAAVCRYVSIVLRHA